LFFRLKAGKTGVGQAAGLDWIGRVGWGGLVALAEKKSPSYSIGGRRQAVLDNQEHHNLTRAQRARLERFGAAACVDIHCHCLPALDDGPKDADKAIALCRALADDGTTVAVATPHQLGRYEGKNQADEIRTAVSDLNALIADASIPLTVVPGGDVRVDERLAALIAADRVLTLADGGRYILLELPHEVFVDIRLLVRGLRSSGITPVVSHPERHLSLARRPDIVAPWLAEGAVLQITAGSFLGDFGRLAKKDASLRTR
jgi:tyrosine-protein phosphatase YwqE